MGNMCCRREVFAPNAAELDPSRCLQQHHQLGQEFLSKQQQQRPAMSSAYHPAGDDCAINELLEGRMDLDVRMPDGRKVRLTVERRTPMMDLLVQAASTTKISPGGHVIQVFGDGDKTSAPLAYKPSTPIGSLDTNTVYIVAKKEAGDLQARRMGKMANNRPFEPTFRVQVHLPRNQLTVLRVSPRVKIAELKTMVCKEKGLDISRYQLVRPSGPSQPLAGDMTLSEYGSTEITLLSNSRVESHICNSTSHILPYSKRSDEQKQRKTGILRLLAEDGHHKETNSNITHQVDGYQRNGTYKIQESSGHQNRFKPKKRRPAPPPPPVLPEAPSHSRQSSSDSSGYHEATSSFLHEEHSSEDKASSDSSGVSSLGGKGPTVQPPSPPAQNSKKKKAPPPPLPPKDIQKQTVLHLNNPATNNPQDSVVHMDANFQEKIESPKEHRQNPVETNSVSKMDPVKKDVIVQSTQVHKKAVAPTHPIVENVLNHKDSLLYKDGSVLQEKPGSQKERNLVFHSDSFLKTDFAKKEMLIQKDYAIKDATPQNGDVVLTNLIVQNVLLDQSDPKVEKRTLMLAKDFIVPKHSKPPKCPQSHETMVVLNNDLNLKDHVTQEDPLIPNDRIQSKDHVVARDQMFQKDPVLRQGDSSEKKIDLINYGWESGGHHQIQVQASVVEKESAVANIMEDPPIDPKETKCEQLIEVKQYVETTSSQIPDEYRIQKKPNKEKSHNKSEAVSTRVALVALNARIEQDVTQQEIASSIQAAFHSLDYPPQPQQPSLLAIKQRNSEDLLPPVHQFSSGTTLPCQKTVVTLNSRSEDNRPSLKESAKYSQLEKEALLIDEGPPPSHPSVDSFIPTASSLKRSSSLLNFADTTPRSETSKNTKRVRNLQRSLSDLSAEDKEDFESEQERLQQEYIKLQRQFILWQQQLMNNHAMLREECIVPQYARTLRQSHSLPEGEDYSDDTTSAVPPLVSRSLSYEPTKDRCSTLPRSTINIPSLEFGSIQINNGTTTLRSSKTKNYFKPPQVRISTKSRQRIPPEIKKEGDVDISDDTKMLTTILPSFESLKLITENSEEDIHLSVSRLKDTISSTKITPFEGKKVPVVHQTFPKINSKLNNGGLNGDKNMRCVNGNNGLFKLPMNNISKNIEQSSNSQHPPPPPPLPVTVGGVSKPSVKVNCAKATGQRNGVTRRDSTPAADPRDQLMLEIRKFGGRTALRKISLVS